VEFVTELPEAQRRYLTFPSSRAARNAAFASRRRALPDYGKDVEQYLGLILSAALAV
jgi:hypothetical protein